MVEWKTWCFVTSQTPKIPPLLCTIVAFRGYGWCGGGFYVTWTQERWMCTEKSCQTTVQTLEYLFRTEVCFLIYIFPFFSFLGGKSSPQRQQVPAERRLLQARAEGLARLQWQREAADQQDAGQVGGWIGSSCRARSRSKPLVELVFLLQTCRHSNLTAWRL